MMSAGGIRVLGADRGSREPRLPRTEGPINRGSMVREQFMPLDRERTMAAFERIKRISRAGWSSAMGESSFRRHGRVGAHSSRNLCATGSTRTMPSVYRDSVSPEGGITIVVPADAEMTARIDGDTEHFAIRDVSILEWTLGAANLQEAFRTGNEIELTDALRVIVTLEGQSPLPVAAGQIVLVRVHCSVREPGAIGPAALVVEGDNWTRPFVVALTRPAPACPVPITVSGTS